MTIGEKSEIQTYKKQLFANHTTLVLVFTCFYTLADSCKLKITG